MKFITQIYNIIINNFTKTKIPTILLGRWNITYNKKIIHRKIDLANEDHCGPCGTKIQK